ncbi:pirin family protein [Pantoea sp. USHLN256]|uniref:pirin family protein n=1 Tax=Pantoea sp. USHLN256 TaxID=3081293 RepID=UPI003016C818
MNILRADRDQLFEYGPFTIRRQRPGAAFGPLAIIDQMTLQLGAKIPLQAHQDDEIFSYVWRGSLLHRTENGATVSLNAKHALMMSAGSGARVEQSAPFIETEMLQASIRPARSGGEARINSFTREDGAAVNAWTLLAGPHGSEAPLTLGQAVYIYDVKLERGERVQLPQRAGYSSWITVLDGIVKIDAERLHKGDSVSAATVLSALTGERDATLVAFMVQDDVPAVLSGTVSGA